MSSPVLVETYPASNDTGIPIGTEIRIKFDQGIDLISAEKAVIIHGPDRDTSSGPGSAEWISLEKERDPFYLSSPHFRGVIDVRVSLRYYDTDDEIVEVVTDPTEEVDLTAWLVITPLKALAADAEYFVNIVGGANGISKRTVFDGVATITGEGICTLSGQNLGGNDSIQVEITTAGEVGTARYKWWYTSLGVGSAQTNKITSRRPRILEDGVAVRFDGTDLQVGDRWQFTIRQIENLAESVQFSFTTNDGSYTEAPTSPSTPAPAIPPLYPDIDSTDQYQFDLVSSDPADREAHVGLDRTTVTLKFNANLDANTVTQQTIRVYRMPVSGLYGMARKAEMVKSLIVSGKTITIGLGD